MKPARLLLTLLMAWALCVAFAGCDDSPPPQSVPPKQQKQVPAQAPPANPAVNQQNPVRTWPPVADEQGGIADNLLQKNYYVVFDCSGSMSEKQCYGEGNKIDVAKKALINFSRLVPEDANLGLTVFINSAIMEMVPLGTGNRAKFAAAVNSTYPSGETPLRAAMEMGYNKLTAQASKQLGYGEYTLVVMTDGMASKGQDPGGMVEKILRQTPIEIHTIGFCIGENHSLNIPGRTVYKAANSQEDLRRGLEDVLAESETFDVSDFGNGR